MTTPRTRALQKPRIPTAHEVRHEGKRAAFGFYRVRYDPFKRVSTYKWQVLGPPDAEGQEEILDDFGTFREAVHDARTRSRGEPPRTDAWRNGGPESSRHTVRVVLRVAPEVRAALEELARRSGGTLSEAAGKAIVERLGRTRGRRRVQSPGAREVGP